MNDRFVLSNTIPDIAAGWVLAGGCRVGPSPPALLALIDAVVVRARAAAESPASLARKVAVRDMLRHGAYKPTGRGKPASEYLLNAAVEDRFPIINVLVDINNLVSLESLLPISLIDADRAGTSRFLVRRGRPGEDYVFNQSGQVLDLEDLLLLAREPDDRPCGTPVKDSQETKTGGSTSVCLGVIFAPAPLREEAARAARRMADLMAAHAGASVEWGVAP